MEQLGEDVGQLKMPCSKTIRAAIQSFHMPVISSIWWIILKTIKKWEILLKVDLLPQMVVVSRPISLIINSPHLVTWV
ncbi:hypothetical protein BRADI_2g02813v3 [Brachypodium distachyon]|uniref:Uncharacterized protein n=1 Tax=Brachypodium distachyon TaxID=15368 RepID=A0A2K2D6K0_BRADI|nr:hypothetical protein BRADI_2g02813v3 [Brachypodium distachyon]